MRAILSILWSAIRLILVGITAFSLVIGGVAFANYTATQGAGTTFGSIVVSTVHYMQMLVCDPVTPANCSSVKTASSVASSDNAFEVAVANANVNGQAAMANSSPVVIASNQTAGDLCMFQAKLGAVINLAASGQVITGTAAKKTYICSIDIISATAQNIALVEGTGSTCATNIFGLAGGTTAATGWNLPANGGLTKGDGQGSVYSPSADTNAIAANVCLLLSGTGQTSGQITYVQG